MSGYPEPVADLIARLGTLPGIGRRSAERLAFHVVTSNADDALGLARAIEEVKRTVRHCRVCYNLTGGERCGLCEDDRRDRGTVMVVEQPKDLVALEAAGVYRGLYHVLMGRIDPIEGVGPGDLTIEALSRRVADPSANAGGVPVAEVVLATSPNLDGDGTALYLQQLLQGSGVAVSRIARGVPTGGQIELTGKAVLAEAILGRRGVGPGQGPAGGLVGGAGRGG